MTNKSPVTEARIHHVHRCSMVDPSDYLSLTSPHPITDDDRRVHATVAQYVAHRLCKDFFVGERDTLYDTPWKAMGVIYRYIHSETGNHKDSIMHLQAVIGRGLIYKANQSPGLGFILRKTGASRILVINDHQTICSSDFMAKIQNRLWGCGTRAEPGENLYGKILAKIRTILTDSFREEKSVPKDEGKTPVWFYVTSSHRRRRSRTGKSL